MSSNHIPPPNRPMPGFPLKLFVKSDQALSSSSSKSSDKPKAVSSVLNDGNEVKEFYENLLIVPDEKSDPQPSGSKHIKPIGQVKQRQSEVVYNQNQLFKAVASNDIETVTQALRSKNGKEILTSGTDHFGWSPLMVASVSGHTSICRLLIRAGADTSVRDRAGNSCLSLATRKGHSKIVDLILQGCSNETVKRKASKKNREPVVDKGCDVCQEHFSTLSSYQTHLASTTHRLKVERAEIEERGGPKAYYGIAQSNVGYQMMVRNDNWDPDSGLGKDSEGKLYPVKTVLKRDRKGLGEGEAPKPKVTHFAPFDSASVKESTKSKKNAPATRLERTSTREKGKRRKKESKQTRNEIDFRREFL